MAARRLSPDEELRQEVQALRGSHDHMRHNNEQRKQRIKVLQHKLKSVEHQRQIAQQDVPHASTTEQLEEAIADMERKLGEAEETRLMYLQMISRLKSETAFFNRDLNKVKAVTDAKEHDEVELQLMLKEATQARNAAKEALREVEHRAQAEQRRRAKELAKRERQLEQRRERCAQHEANCAARRQELMIAQEQARASMGRTIKNPTTAEEELQQISYYEHEFKQIQNVIGAVEVQDIISKFLRQEDTYNMLNMMTKDSHSRIGATKQAKAEAQAAVERFRYEGIGQEAEAQPSRHADTLQPYASLSADDGGAAPAWSSQHDSRLRRTTLTLIEVRAGVQHLVDLLANSQALDLEEFEGSLETDDKLVEGLEYVTRNIQRLVLSTSDIHQDLRARREIAKGGASEAQQARLAELREAPVSAEDAEVFLLTSKADNFRLAEPNELADNDDDDDDDNELAKDVVLSSADVKAQAERLVFRHTKPKRRKGKALGDDDVGTLRLLSAGEQPAS